MYGNDTQVYQSDEGICLTVALTVGTAFRRLGVMDLDFRLIAGQEQILGLAFGARTGMTT
jgi:hypothetical protein